MGQIRHGSAATTHAISMIISFAIGKFCTKLIFVWTVLDFALGQNLGRCNQPLLNIYI